ncbi:MAG: tRNA-dihydrouridine synthase family protein [Ruminococcaceae bacterium]|jgi:tRNA-dihydrouridine synthase|nr:tRNA-dihydrouridine synthase family protein [Oscillospiraceae bacterium]
MDRVCYAAPLEGLTTWLWRRVHHDIFGGADKYFTPFLSPNANRSFQTKELREISRNGGLPVVPQLLTARADHFIWAARTLADMGYEQVDLNAGCPAGTVTAKHKGAGLLIRPDELDALLEGVFTALPDMRISVKTRIGGRSDDEWPALLAIYDRYPIHELTVHPRVQRDFYSGTARRAVFDWTRRHTSLPLVYNGDVAAPDDPAFDAGLVMAGRGLMADPALLRRARGGPPASRQELIAFHDALAGGYEAELGDQPALHRLWELWAYLVRAFPGAEPYLKRMRKCRSLAEYRPLARTVLTGLPLRWEEQGG